MQIKMHQDKELKKKDKTHCHQVHAEIFLLMWQETEFNYEILIYRYKKIRKGKISI